MKKINLTAAAFLLAAIAISCNKEDNEPGKAPSITLLTGAGYPASNDTLAVNQTFKVGVVASKVDSNDALTMFSATYNFNGGPELPVESVVFTGTEKGFFYKDIITHTGDSVGRENYTFSIHDRQGLADTVKLTIIVR